LIEENNILLMFPVANPGYDFEEVLCPVTKKYSPTCDDEDIEPEEAGEDEELLNWDKKTEEVKEITPEVSVEEVTLEANPIEEITFEVSVEEIIPKASIEEITPKEESTTPEAPIEEITPKALVEEITPKEEEITLKF